ncbi:MAG: hypothetical protein HC911_18200 [Chloroflexaceae bacterium]|nr:hypothetical protein [Chloroflexaceae bacterium]
MRVTSRAPPRTPPFRSAAGQDGALPDRTAGVFGGSSPAAGSSVAVTVGNRRA